MALTEERLAETTQTDIDVMVRAAGVTKRYERGSVSMGGEVFIQGVALGSMSDTERTRYRARRIGSQHPRPPNWS